MRNRDFFQIDAPALAIGRALGRPQGCALPPRALVFDLQGGHGEAREPRIDGRSVAVVPFPLSVVGIAALALDTNDYPTDSDDVVRILLPRAAFDRLADRYGAERIAHLVLRPGIATGDVVMSHLGACLTHALERAAAQNLIVVEQIAMALSSHLAQRYGGMRTPKLPASGGLSPWQLRLARNTLERNLGQEVCLEELAKACGLSVSHFSRAFRRSTGLAPHRWLMRRRIEVAKAMVLEGAMPLAEIALACCFSDQSHFTRVFSSITGMPPARWRATQVWCAKTDAERAIVD